MKKIFALLMAVMMLSLVMLAVVPAGAEATEKTAGPLIITEIHNNPAAIWNGNSRDYTEYMEIMNVGNEAIDLYEYKFYYTTSANGLASCPYPEPGKSKWNVFAPAPGVNVLEPGEIAVIWFVTTESILTHDDADKPIPTDIEYFRKEITEADKANYEYTATDYEGKVYAYNVDAFKTGLKTSCAEKGWDLGDNLDNAKIICWDINLDYEKPSDADIEAGFVGGSAHFNMANCSADKAVKYWVIEKEKDAEVFDENSEFICTAGVEKGGKYSGQTFHYYLQPGSVDLVYLFDNPFLTPGYLYEAHQGDLVNIRHAIDPQKYPDTAIVVTTTEPQEENVTTTEEITNPPVTPTETEKPSNTTKPVTTTKAPDSTTAADSATKTGGCGGFTAAAQLFALVVAAAAFVVIKKK